MGVVSSKSRERFLRRLGVFYLVRFFVIFRKVFCFLVRFLVVVSLVIFSFSRFLRFGFKI